jgi:hypothetical protein
LRKGCPLHKFVFYFYMKTFRLPYISCSKKKRTYEVDNPIINSSAN